MGFTESSHRSSATYQLSIQDVFNGLSQQEKLYAHHLSQAAWNGARIILRQTSPEGNGIFDFILELHKACEGQWNQFIERFGLSAEELNYFLDYAGMFLSKMNNFCVGIYLACVRCGIITNLYHRERATRRLSPTSRLMRCVRWPAFRRLP